MAPPSMSTLPPDFIAEILTELPVKSLVRFMCVSKSFNALINDPYFIKKHLKRSIETNRERTLIVEDCKRLHNADPLFLKFEDKKRRPPDYYSVRFHEDGRFDRAVQIFQPLRHERAKGSVVYSCNGLVCLYNLESEITIWNPLIRKYKNLPFEPIDVPSGFEKDGSYSVRNSPATWSQLAFGHDPVSDDYKVVKVSELCKGRLRSFEVKVYSLRANSWRRVKDKWPIKSSVIGSKPAFLNGALHWLAKMRRSLEMLVALDLATEKFQKYRTPFKYVFGVSEPDLVVLGGYLCVFMTESLKPHNITVWVMRKYGVESSWTLLYTIVCGPCGAVPRPFRYCKPLAFAKNGKKILMQQDFDKLFWYDIKEDTCSKFEIVGMPDMFRTATCVGSLVLLDGDSVIDVDIEDGEPEDELTGTRRLHLKLWDV
ncbi:F-box protein CPR1-like isoform X2 [Corylus avellana]|uniref:F-box protein CPR1-like isoform X2 n=1 Tax=Corylus avellana TaxID=13451 RepID=UPI00286B4A32|nr:F-box protein CPR1-like isoform X2 [Corylus avellana]